MIFLALGLWMGLFALRRRRILAPFWQRTAIAVCVIVTGVAALTCFAFRPVKDLNLARLMIQFESLAHPPDSQLIQRNFNFGVLNSSSNHCDYYVAQWRRSTLTDKALQTHYQKLSLHTAENQANAHNEALLHPDVWAADPQATTNSLLVETRSNVGFTRLVSNSIFGSPKASYEAGTGHSYLVFVGDGGYPATDLRCL